MEDKDDIQHRLAQVEAERDALLNSDVAEWLEAVGQRGASVLDFQNSVSWRITRPLRLVRSYQLRASRDGWGSATAQAALLMRKRLRDR